MNLTALFLLILKMSLTSTCVIAVVLAVRLVLKKLRTPTAIMTVLWLVVLFRLLCPVSIDGAASLFVLPMLEQPRVALTDMASASLLETQVLSAEVISESEKTTQNIQAATTAPSTNVYPQNNVHWLLILSLLWLAGVLGMLLYSIRTYQRLRRHIGQNTRLRDNIYESANISSPFVCGWIRPRIYLPAGLSEKELPYLLSHEQAHIRRLDHLFKPLFFGAVALHWFNPLVWLAFTLVARDMEMACDERVLKKFGTTAKQEYGRLLFCFAVQQTPSKAAHLGFGESGISQRIKHILIYKKPPKGLMIIAVLLCVVTVILSACDPATNTSSKNEPAPTGSTPVNTEMVTVFGQEYSASTTEFALVDTGAVGDLSELAKLPLLSHLIILNTQVEDATGLAELTNLQTLHISYSNISDLSLLQNLTSLRELLLAANREADTVTIGENSYAIDTTVLSLEAADSNDLAAISQLTKLQSLTMSHMEVGDLSYLKNLDQLTMLKIEFSDLSDLSALSSRTNLEVLLLGGNQITDITPLKALTGLTRLALNNEKLSDLSALGSMNNLQVLELHGAQIDDYSPLTSLSGLRQLSLVNSNFSDLSLLDGLTSLEFLELPHPAFTASQEFRTWLEQRTEAGLPYLSNNVF